MERLICLCHVAASQGASDVFFREGEPPRQRLHGSVCAFPDAGVVTHAELVPFFQACGRAPGAPGDHDVHWEVGSLRFRVNLHHHLDGLGAVLRIIRKDVPSMESLGLPVSLLEHWIRRPHGLILITGPTGSGKSTTVAAMLEALNQWCDGHIITIEEPIEFLFRSKKCLFTQREIPSDVPNFTVGLRSALRQSPDVIFMGEVRDYESARIALQAAETGHLVISTLHTSTVTETMERLANLLPHDERQGTLTLLAAQLIGVLTQKLLPSMQEGRCLVTEYFQNEAATRDWIVSMDYARLGDYIRGQGSTQTQAFTKSIFNAWADGYVAREAALGATAHPHELERAMRGISG